MNRDSFLSSVNKNTAHFHQIMGILEKLEIKPIWEENQIKAPKGEKAKEGRL